MNPCSYARTQDPDHAVRKVSSDPKAAFLAGGTTLIDLMKEEVMRPTSLVDISELPWNHVEDLPGGGLRVGAMVTNTDLAYHPKVVKHYPVLSQAILSGASPQLRNLATTGGNILQRTRCTYFRDVAMPCNKREPGTGCGALHGYNRGLAILGTSNHCIASHPSDMCVALSALDAVLLLEGPKGERRIPINDFYLLPGSTPHIENQLRHGELIKAVEIPALAFATNSHYLKVRDRASYEFALVSVAVALDLSGSKIRAARLALGGVGTKPWRCFDAEKALVSGAGHEHAAQLALQGAHPYEHNAFKVKMAHRAILRALETVSGGNA